MIRALALVFAILLVECQGAGAAIGYVNSADLGNETSATSYTVAYDVTAGSNLLVIVVATDNVPSDDLSSVTYAGATMTLAGKVVTTLNSYGSRSIFQLYLMNPSVGTNNFVITRSSGTSIFAICAEYSGALAAEVNVENTIHNAGGLSSMTTAITTISDNSWAITGGYSYAGGGPPTAGAGNTFRVAGVAFGTPGLIDSGGPVHPAGSFSSIYNPANTGGATDIGAVVASFPPTLGGGLMLMGCCN